MGTQRSRARLRVGRRLLLAAMLGAVLAAVGAPTLASAHAVLVTSSPADGSRVARSPAHVTLRFDEHVQPVAGDIHVISSSGSRVDTGQVHHRHSSHTLVIPLHRHLPRNSYTATWRVVSADTHIVSGSVNFGVKQAATSSGQANQSSGHVSSLHIVASGAQGVGYLGVIMGFGVPAVGLGLWPSTLASRRTRVLMITGWGLLAAAALAELLVAGPRAADSGWPGVLHADHLRHTLTSSDGAILIIRLVLVAAVAAATAAGIRPQSARQRVDPGRRSPQFHPSWIAAAGIAAAGTLVTIAARGHAAVGPDAWIAVPAAVAHLASIAVWLGGLTLLSAVVLPRLHMGQTVPRLLQHWSRLAFLSVVVLIVSGEYQGWRQLQPLDALWSTRYGITLLIKLGLVTIAMAAALISQRVVAGRTRHRHTSIQLLTRSVRLEAIILAGAVAAATVLVSLPPAKTTYGPPATLTAPLGPNHLKIAVDTTRRGPQNITITAHNGAGQPAELTHLTATLSSPQADVAALKLQLKHGPHNRWHTKHTTVPRPGTWHIHINASTNTTHGYATTAKYQVW